MVTPVSVKLPTKLQEQLDDLIEKGVFTSRSDALRYGARLAVMTESRRLTERAEELAVTEIHEKLKRTALR